MTIDATTIEWAKERVGDLMCLEINGGNALEKLMIAIIALRETADQAVRQPESDMFKSYADDLEKTLIELMERHKALKKDRLELGHEIVKFVDGGGSYA